MAIWGNIYSKLIIETLQVNNNHGHCTSAFVVELHLQAFTGIYPLGKNALKFLQVKLYFISLNWVKTGQYNWQRSNILALNVELEHHIEDIYFEQPTTTI